MENVGSKMAKGAIWMVFLRLSIKGIGIISTLILARLLTPDDFGLMALGTSIYAIVELMRAFGFDTVLIQNQKSDRSHYDTAWTMQIIFSLIASSLIIAISDYAADYYNDSRLADVLKVMSLLILINGFNNIGVVEFRKKMTFNKEFAYQVLIKLSGFCVTIPLAWYLRSYWALLMGLLSANITSLILSYTMQKYRPRVCLDAWRELMSFSSWLMVNNVFLFIYQHGQNFILAKMIAPASVGLYAITNEISSITTSELVGAVNRAAFPGYSSVNENLVKLTELYLKTLGLIAFIIIPCCVGISAVALIMVPVVLGDKWIEIIPLMELIAFSNIFIGLGTNLSSVFLAIKLQKLNLLYNILRSFMFISLVVYFIEQYNLVGIGYAMVVTSIAMYFFTLILSKMFLNLSLYDSLSRIIRPGFASSIMYVSLLYYYDIYTDLTALNLFLGVMLGAILYALSIVILWICSGRPDGVERQIIMKFTKKAIFYEKKRTNS